MKYCLIVGFYGFIISSYLSPLSRQNLGAEMFCKVGKWLNSLLHHCRTKLFSRGGGSLSCCCRPRDDHVLPTTSTRETPSGADRSIRNQIRLCYYTFFYNEASDPLLALETICAPFAECFNQTIRVFGVVWRQVARLIRISHALFVFERPLFVSSGRCLSTWSSSFTSALCRNYSKRPCSISRFISFSATGSPSIRSFIT